MRFDGHCGAAACTIGLLSRSMNLLDRQYSIDCFLDRVAF